MNEFAGRQPNVWKPSHLSVVALLAATAVCAAVAGAQLRSPWDGHPVRQSADAYACPALAHIAPDLVTDGFYRLDDPTHSIIDPVREEAYRKSSGVVKDVGLAIVKSADDYRTTGSRQAAQCTMSRIVTMARDKSLSGKMSSGQAYYVQGWIAGAVAIAYLKVRDGATASPGDTAMIAPWLLRIGEQTKKFYDKRAKPGQSVAQNNHLYWAGVELAAIAVTANDHGDFDWAMSTYANGVDQIRPDGTLPLEMERGTRALHYHLYALAPLVLLAEFGEANDLDLYARDHGAIRHLERISIDGLHDASLFEKATGIKQEVPRTPSGDAIGWAPPYLRRFPDPELARLVAAAPNLSVYYLGGLAPPL